VDKGGVVGGEEGVRGGDLLSPADPAERYPVPGVGSLELTAAYPAAMAAFSGVRM